MAQKIATCCYCGTRAALVFCGKARHELGCATCGAPLRHMKALPMQVASVARSPVARAADYRKKPAKPAKTRRRPSKVMRRFSPIRAFRNAIEEVWDEIEDFFD